MASTKKRGRSNELASLHEQLAALRATASDAAVRVATEARAVADEFALHDEPAVAEIRERLWAIYDRTIAAQGQPKPAGEKPILPEPCRYQSRFGDRVHGCQKPKGHDGEHETCYLPAAPAPEREGDERLGSWALTDYLKAYNPLTATPCETAVYELARRALARSEP